MDITESFPQPLLASSAVLSLLGQGADSVFPRVGVEMPPDESFCPWIWFVYEDAINTADFTMQQIVHIRIYDKRGEQYWNINKIIAAVAKVYPSNMNGIWYPSDDGPAWRQQITLISQPSADDQWNLLQRWIDVQLWRASA